MKLYTFELAGAHKVGVERAGLLVDVSDVAADMLALIRGGAAALGEVERRKQDTDATSYTFHQIKLRAPVPRPGKILCCGLNYKSHIEENPAAVFPDEPDFFCKVPSAVIGPGDPIVIPPMSKQVDYEAEFAVVIGQRMHHVRRENVFDHIFGYTILHDVSARDVQFKPNGRTRGKNFDTFAPIGPCIVTRDEIPDVNNLSLRTWLNGELMQDGNTRDWVFPPEIVLEYISNIMTLEPGDVVSTGTPAGVGYFRRPQVFLKAGDVAAVEIRGIGRLENPIIGFQP